MTRPLFTLREPISVGDRKGYPWYPFCCNKDIFNTCHFSSSSLHKMGHMNNAAHLLISTTPLNPTLHFYSFICSIWSLVNKLIVYWWNAINCHHQYYILESDADKISLMILKKSLQSLIGSDGQIKKMNPTKIIKGTCILLRDQSEYLDITKTYLSK